MAFVPYTQVTGVSSMTVEIRTNVDPASVLGQSREVLREISPDLTPLQPMTQQEQFEQSYSDERLFARLAVFFGVLAVVLVATGLFGTLGYRVNRRIGEIGLRMALGAQRRQMLWMVVRESLAIAGAGAAVGVPLAVGAAQLLRSSLFNLSPADPPSFGLALAGIAAVTIAAAAVPARRASAVDPMSAIRAE
jgi:ABC-type antimicrobial peptide transport system permease subunit